MTQFTVNTDTHAHTHTHLDADWLVAVLPVEDSLGVEDRAATVFTDRRANFISLTTDDRVGVRHWRHKNTK